MLGSAAVEYFVSAGHRVVAYEHKTLDITDGRQVTEVFEEHHPELAINCAAWTDVDGCELDSGKAYEVNAWGPENLALNCGRVGALFISISTDYVFDGMKAGFYTQCDQPHPLSVYGAAKLEGETRVKTSWARSIIVRTGWLYGKGGNNFLSRVVDYAQRGQPLKVISDSFGSPTFALDLVQRLEELALKDIPGTYHVVGSGEGASYESFSTTALELANVTAALEVVTSDALNRPAPRPRNSRLKCVLSEAIGLKPLPDWKDGLARFLRESATSAVPLSR